MPKNFLKIVLLFSLYTGTLISQEIHDLIQPVRLTAGEIDSVMISDIFYSENYDVAFHSNETVDIKYFPQEKIVIFTPSDNFKGIELISFTSANDTFRIPLISEEKFKKTFSYKPKEKVEKVNLFGSFNGWNRESNPMLDENNDGVYETSIMIEPGRYEYKFFVDPADGTGGKELVDDINPEKVPNGMGDFNSILTVKSPGSKIFLHKLDIKEKGEEIVLSFSPTSTNKALRDLKKNEVIALIDNKLVGEELISIVSNKINITLNKNDLRDYKTIRVAVNRNSSASNIQNIFLKDAKPVSAGDKKLHQGNIIYSIMVDRFFDGDKTNSIPVVHPELSEKANYQGGDLQGILEKINEGYFDKLGINTLWISPVVQNTDSAYQEYPAPHRWYTGYHGYWPTHPTNIEERFGNMNLLKKLIGTAQNKNMKILLDYVAHHIHIEHPLWKEHKNWFGSLDLPDGRKNLRLWDEHRLTTWFEPYLPSFDFVSSKDALEVVTENAMWWLKETGIDGFRHDAVKHVPNEFWRLLTNKIKSKIEIPEKRSVYQIGETFGSYDLISSYVNNGQLSAQFNFNLYDTAFPVFLEHNVSFSALDDQMQKTFSVYGVNHTMGNIMDSHDKVRYMAYVDGDVLMSSGNPDEIGWENPPEVDDRRSYDKLKLYLSYLLTIPGVPVIYYGDEIGMTGASDPDNRRMMRFGKELSIWEEQTLIDVRKIVNIRKNHSALKYGDFLTLKAEGNVYVYLRSDFNERILIVLNKGDVTEKIKLEMPPVYTSNVAVDLISGEKFLINSGNLYLTIPSTGYKIFNIR